MPDDKDITVEHIPGLPEALPDGERILWQGRPKVMALAQEALSLNWILGYFALLIVWRVGVSTTLMPFGAALLTAIPFLILGAVAAAILILIAYVQARATVYTITTERVAMRVGANSQRVGATGSSSLVRFGKATSMVIASLRPSTPRARVTR